MQHIEDRAEEQATLALYRIEGLSEEIEALRDNIKGFSARFEAELMAVKKAICGSPCGGRPEEAEAARTIALTGARSARERISFGTWNSTSVLPISPRRSESPSPLFTLLVMLICGGAPGWKMMSMRVGPQLRHGKSNGVSSSPTTQGVAIQLK